MTAAGRIRTLCLCSLILLTGMVFQDIGREVSLVTRLQDGDEFRLSIPELIEHGRRLFSASWTSQEGAGRPLSKGTGASLTDPASPLVFPRNFNRISGPEANSCAGCHNLPFGIPGGSGDIVTNVFVMAQRFDHVDFNPGVTRATRSSRDEMGRQSTLARIANNRSTTGMFGSGYIEMLARQITADLQRIRDSMQPGDRRKLTSKGISFGELKRIADGRWNTSGVSGLAASSLATFGSDDLPTLLVLPFHQSGAAVSLRQFTNSALNHHHGIQSTERFEIGVDEDGDGFVNEISRAEVTALTIYQAALPVPGRVIPRSAKIERAVAMGQRRFEEVGCAGCHLPRLPLAGDLYSEPNPYNPPGNLESYQAPSLAFELGADELPQPRLEPDEKGVVWVPAYTDLKLHDITSGREDPNREPLDMQQPIGLKGFFEGNSRFLTRSLWGLANQPPYFHHGKFTTIRDAVLAHRGEAQAAADAFRRLPAFERDCIIEFLKTLRILPPGSRNRIVDETGRPRDWPNP